MYPMEHIWTIVMLEICKHTFYAYLSRIWKMMQFTGFIRKVFATKILLSGKFSLFVTLLMKMSTTNLTRVRKSKIFPYSKIFHAKTFRIKRVNRDTFAFATKVRKSLSRHTCQSAKTIVIQKCTIWMLQTIKYLSRNFLYAVESFRTNWKLSRSSGNFPDHLKSFQSVRKLSRLSRNFPHCLEIFQTVLKLFRLSWNFPDNLETFHTCLLFSSVNVKTTFYG